MLASVHGQDSCMVHMHAHTFVRVNFGYYFPPPPHFPPPHVPSLCIPVGTGLNVLYPLQYNPPWFPQLSSLSISGAVQCLFPSVSSFRYTFLDCHTFLDVYFLKRSAVCNTFLLGAHPSKVPHPMGDLDPIKYMVSWFHPDQHLKWHLIGLAVFTGLTNVTNRQTDRPRYSCYSVWSAVK